MRAPLVLLSGLVTALLLFTGLPPEILTAAPEGPTSALDPLAGDLLQGYSSASGSFGTVYFPAQAHVDGEGMPSRIQTALERVEARLGRRRGRPITAVMTPERREFSRVFAALAGERPRGWMAGAAFPALDLLVVRGDLFPFLAPPGGKPREVLEHELAHLIIHRRPGVTVPRWFDEGAAMWAAGIRLLPEDEAFLAGLARLRGLYTLEALEREIPGSHDLAAIAYQESLLLVEWIVLRLGPGAVGGLLDSLEEGEDLYAAFERKSGLDREGMERQFLAWLRGRRSLWELVLHTLSLWTVASLLALVAIGRSLVRRRRRLKEMEEDEST